MKKHNFYAGPAILPEVAIEETIKALKDFAGTGISLACVSHRSKEFDAIMLETIKLFKEILNVPEGYSVVLVGGGASLQFAMVPFNLMTNKAVYLNTGEWSTKAIKEAKMFGSVIEIKGADFYSIPKVSSIDESADYFHFTSNNTIYGTEILHDFDFKIPVVSDMSSDILSRQLDVSKYGIIYGGAQKNLAPAGVAFAIVKDDILGKVTHKIPSMLNYKVHAEKDNMYNTPPVIPIFTLYQTLKWVKEVGGVAEMERRAIEKSTLLYNEIDRNKLFRGTVAVEDRSRTNVCWVMNEEYKELEGDFNKYATENGIIGAKGHRSVGGFRASLYNALDKESVEALISVMKAFEADKA